MSKIFTWVNSDLDGACSVILLGNAFPNMEYRHVFFGDFEAQYEEWEKNNLEDYDKVFIVGLVLNQTLVNKLDDPKVVFVSDRGENFKVYDSSLICENTTSCSKLLYKKFKNIFEIPVDLKKLIGLADDYNSYKLKFKESEYLNAVYRNTKYNRFATFVKRFWNGYDGFTETETLKAEAFFDALEEEYQNLEIFSGTYKDWRVLSVVTKFSVNEIAKKLIDNHETDAIIVVNPDTKFVSFRKPEGSSADITLMAEKLCNGGGGEWASGGKMTEKFLEFTTKLEQI